MTRHVAAVALSLALLCQMPGQAAYSQTAAERLNDYTTASRADYVFGCMAANGQGRDILLKCACSIDHIATILPYERYVEAETVLSMQLTGGERMSFFRTSAMAKEIVADLRRAQAEAEILCFQ